MINDGSTDGSGQICDKYVNTDSRYRVIHKHNEGLSAARNDGINAARADYIMFVDSDDWVEPGFCLEPYQIAKKYNADIVAFMCARYGKKRRKRNTVCTIEGVVSKEDALTKYWCDVTVNVWNKLYKRSVFNGIQYPIGYYCEDIAITHLLIYASKIIYVLDKLLYHHREYRVGSITNQRSKVFVEDSFYFNFKRIEDLKRWGLAYKSEEKRIALSYLIIVGVNSDLSNYCEMTVRNMDSHLDRTVGWKYRFMLMLYRLFPKAFNYISRISGKRNLT